MSKWIEWKGGEMPVHADCVVDVKLRDGMTTEFFTMDVLSTAGSCASSWDWKHSGLDCDIVAYRLRQLRASAGRKWHRRRLD
ncbi:hypothetical protein [Erwinia phage Gungnir39]|nr:hypothetical protein [Erwinia phage Gungnir39]